MKVLYLISSLGGGGAESQLCYFVSELKKAHPEIVFSVCILKSGGALETRLKKDGIDYYIIGRKNIIQYFHMVKQLVKKQGINIVHAHMFYADIVARLSKMRGIKIVATHHGLGKWKNKPMLFLDKLAKHRVDQFIMVSSQSYEIRLNREKYPASKMSIVYNGVSGALIADSPKEINNNDNIIIGTIARFTDNKQINILIDVMQSLKGYENITLEIIGTGENEDTLKEQVRMLGLNERVKFWGWCDDIRGITANWKIFSLCSINEDLPVSIIEAMAQGIVPIASDVGGISELLDNGNNGILCDSSDKETFVKAVIYLLKHPDEYRVMSEKSIQFVADHFLISQSVENTIAIYNDLLAKRD